MNGSATTHSGGVGSRSSRAQKHQPGGDEDSDRPAGRHQPGAEKERRHGEHCGQGHDSGGVLSAPTRVPRHGGIVPPSRSSVSGRFSSGFAQRGPYDEIERRPRVRPRAGRCCARSASSRPLSPRSICPACACMWPKLEAANPSFSCLHCPAAGTGTRPRDLGALSASGAAGISAHHPRQLPGTRPRTPTLLLFGAATRFSACADKSPAPQLPGVRRSCESHSYLAPHTSWPTRPDVVVDRALKFFAGPSRQVDLP